MNRFSNFILTILAFSIFSTSCSNKDGVTINVKVNSHEKSVLYFSRVDFKQSVIIDSVKISKGENSKKFRVKQGVEPTFYTLSFKKGGAITLLANQGENITANINTKNILAYTVTGSIGSSKVQEIAIAFAKSKQKIDALQDKYVKCESETEKKTLEKEFDSIYNEQKDFTLNFIRLNPMSKANIMAIYQKYNDNLYLFNTSDDLLTMKTVASAWNAIYPESDYTKGMIDDIKRIERSITNNQLQKFIAESEVSIPELEIPNKDGVNVKLSSLKGKVVLLDFWVSSNTNSLLDNRELLDIYKQYKSKGFEVYQISLDANREEWINTVETSNLPWISVCEGSANGSYAASIYNISQIPANYLIGRNQSIIGKNLYGADLRKALAKVLN